MLRASTAHVLPGCRPTQMDVSLAPATDEDLASGPAGPRHRQVRLLRRWWRPRPLEVAKAAEWQGCVVRATGDGEQCVVAYQFGPWMQNPSLYMLQSCAPSAARWRLLAAALVAHLFAHLDVLAGVLVRAVRLLHSAEARMRRIRRPREQHRRRAANLALAILGEEAAHGHA